MPSISAAAEAGKSVPHAEQRSCPFGTIPRRRVATIVADKSMRGAAPLRCRNLGQIWCVHLRVLLFRQQIPRGDLHIPSTTSPGALKIEIDTMLTKSGLDQFR